MLEQISHINNNSQIDRVPPNSSGFKLETIIIELEKKCKKPLNRCEMRHCSIFTLSNDLDNLSPKQILEKHE